MSDPVLWGILGTGAIARAFADALRQSSCGRLHAVASRQADTAARFAADYQLPRYYGDYDHLLADAEVRAVYIATPHPLHAPWTLRAIAAGKSVLCEKPLCLNHPQAMEVVEAARERGVFLMEAFMYRCHPQTTRLVQLLRERVIGDVRLIQASFGFQAGFRAESRLFSPALGGGGILDVGCYPVSLSRLIAGLATGADFANPLDVKGVSHLGVTGVDEWAAAVLRFPGDILAEVSTGICQSLENTARIFGSDGRILLPNPWQHDRKNPNPGKIILQRHGRDPEEIIVPATVTSFTYEADLASRAILEGQPQAPPPAMTWDDSLGNLLTLDRWRESVGLTYDVEKPSHPRPPLRRRTPSPMPTGTVAGIALPVSRLVMGCDNQPTYAHAAVMFDDYFEHGGNCFDTAWVYGGGKQERLVGEWIANRGLRDQIVLIVKGAHQPYCDPINLTRQLHESLERLQTDYADLYLMHRDNPDVPVGEFVEVLNEHLRAGRIRAFGGSNWSLERVAAANAYAAAHGLTGFAAVSNNFSLARMIAPVWKGCIQASDPASRQWLTEHQLPLFAWSSQARGFFTERADRADDPELKRCWFSDDNFQRRQRACELARQRGVAPINIALAYVLHQPFPTFALVGPRNLREWRATLPALSVRLTPAEVRWLNLE